MKTNFQTILLIFLLSCTSPSPKLDKPKDYSDVFQEVKMSTELKQNPKLQSKIVNTIQEQSHYSNSCYAKIQELARLTKLEAEKRKTPQRK
ncbi:MAG: hypothetical protein N3A69_04155 [Leptospiraceae bacterium]|nr:hypothetical protein [Leptospiraceae bacterium]